MVPSFMLIFLCLSLVTSQSPASYLSCSVDGCTPTRAGNLAYMGIPPAPVKQQWVYPASSRKQSGVSFVGCSSNGDKVACVLPQQPGLVVLNANGSLYWDSYRIDGLFQNFSGAAPVISDQGLIAATDGKTLIYYLPTGQVIWANEVNDTYLAQKYSMGASFNGYFPIRLGDGRYAIYEAPTGLCFASLAVGLNQTDLTYYPPSGTPATNIDRSYILTSLAIYPFYADSTSITAPPTSGRLYAIDVAASSTQRLAIRWWLDFPRAIEGQGPHVFVITGHVNPVILFFALDQTNSPTLFAALDSYPPSAGSFLWSQSFSPSSFGLLQDTNDTYVWLFDDVSNLLIKLNVLTGEVADKLSFELLGVRGVPTSRAIIAPLYVNSSFRQPVFLAAFASSSSSQLVALDLQNRSLLWTYELTTNVTGQLTLVDPNNEFHGGLIAFATIEGDILAVG